MVSDRVGDFIVRLQNAAAIGAREVTTPRSSHLVAIAGKLRELGFVESVEDGERSFSVRLAYGPDGRPRLHGVKRLSKPGRRLYVPATGAHSVKGGMGARILSSSHGIVSDKEARKNRLGGETLFEIW
ncbi:MAG: 30S ribosomal protein S8 [Patescibacteria group bacterium]|nr:30S ribosomal protein S8 [Patescibacteria group bacterium]MDE1944111.1 30S ribosomal protein S8 [Patescibacteria group bacterium]MDE1945044.1 30S ribosomal protein S8 [Patescibacteria group bacterium]MDE2057504.1 30S ribosomal protein S8 [Patescibacteria group bacterium]